MAIIHVNSHTIRANQKLPVNERKPPLSIRRTRSAKAEAVWWADIHDKDGKIVATVTYQPEKPLSCGARVWIETKYPVSQDPF
jgi:hypothetical protein